MSSALWQVRATVGEPDATVLFLGALTQFPINETFEFFARRILERSFDPEKHAAIRQILLDRGILVQLAGLQLPGGEHPSGAVIQGSLFLSGQAPRNGASVALSTDVQGLVLPATTVVPFREISADFDIELPTVSTATSGRIFAAYDGVTVESSIVITPTTAFSLALSKDLIIGGKNLRGTVSVPDPAPKGGVIVQLASSSRLNRAPSCSLSLRSKGLMRPRGALPAEAHLCSA